MRTTAGGGAHAAVTHLASGGALACVLRHSKERSSPWHCYLGGAEFLGEVVHQLLHSGIGANRYKAENSVQLARLHARATATIW